MFYFFIFIIGLSVGSFLNVLIDRLPHNQSLFGRSYCDSCRKQLVNYDLFPVVSFFILRGMSRCCNKQLSWYYPLVELSTGILFILLWTYIPAVGIYKFLYLAIGACLIVIFFSDFKYQIIPDEILIVFGLFTIPFLTHDTMSRFIGAGVLFGIFQLIHSATKGKAMGYGDVKFAFVIGLLQGLKLGAISIYLSFLMGGIVGIALVILHMKKPKSAIAFGPFLVTGVLLTIFFEKTILRIAGEYFYPLR